jgi:hypothetical protein
VVHWRGVSISFWQRAAIAARIQSEFTWDICGAKMMNLYQQLLAQ